MWKRLFKSKKGFNDVSIISILLAVLLLSAVLIPYVTAEFGADADDWDTVDYESEIKDDARDVSSINAFTVLVNVMRLAFWDIGDELALPFWLDLIYTLIAVILIIVIARNVWIGGGA